MNDPRKPTKGPPPCSHGLFHRRWYRRIPHGNRMKFAWVLLLTSASALAAVPSSAGFRIEIDNSLSPLVFPDEIDEVPAETRLEAENLEITESAPIASDECSGQEYAVRSGDTLGSIARSVLGDGRRWPDILALNADTVKNPDLLRPGMKLVVSCDTGDTGTQETVTPGSHPAERDQPLPAGENTLLAAVAADPDPEGGTGPDSAGIEPDRAEAPEEEPPPANERTQAREDCETAIVTTGDAAEPGHDPDRPGSGQEPKYPCADENLEPPAIIVTAMSEPDAGPPPARDMITGRDASWSARRGEFLVDVLMRWGRGAGYTVILRDRYPWVMGVNYEFAGGFREALNDLLSGFHTSGRQPAVTLYKNDVMILEVR